MRLKYVLLLVLFVLYGCVDDNICNCVETTTRVLNNVVNVNEYWIECDAPFTQLMVYDWGNVVIDCR